MRTFDVYPRYPVSIDRAAGAWVYDSDGQRYLDCYGGHAVISIGHSHPHYINRINEQLKKVGFYSNSVQLPIQEELAEKLGKLSGYESYQIFYCNSGAEANENALKLASFHTGREGLLSFKGGFHGRTSLAVSLTDSEKIKAPVNRAPLNYTVDWNDRAQIVEILLSGKIAAVIIEGIQGIGGIISPQKGFLGFLQEQCQENGTLLILDEIQSGSGRTGRYFAHQYEENLQPDIITLAKGMGNGFPIGAVWISPKIDSSPGMLGTTFGGSPLACAAALAVAEVIEDDNLMDKAAQNGNWLKTQLEKIPEIKEIRGEGLMLGLDFDFPVSDMRKKLLMDEKIFTGSSSRPNTLRLLPPLNIEKEELSLFITALKNVLK